MFQRKRTSSSSASAKPAATTPISTEWYDNYYGQFAEGESIGPAGIEKLCSDLGLDPTDVLVLVMAWLLSASQMGYFTKDEWSKGASALGRAQSPAQLKECLQDVYLRTRQNKERLRDLHKYTHKFCKEDDKRKNIDAESALAMLQLLHGAAFPKHVPKLIEFLQTHEQVQKRGVSLDEWSMVLNFCTEISPDCSNYQDDGAWPLLLDEYVEFRRTPDVSGLSISDP